MAERNVLAKANLGRTSFRVVEELGNAVAIVRNNSDGETTFRVPRALFDEYAAGLAGQVLARMIREVPRD